MTDSFLYCWTDHKTNKLYVGVHKGTSNDGYICSSIYMLEEYEKRPEDFSRQVVAFGSWSDIRTLETKVLQSVNAAYSNNFYNQSNAGGVEFTPEVRQKMKTNHKGMNGKSHIEESKRQIGRSNSKSLQGKTHSKETRKKMSESHKGQKRGPASEEHKRKNREARKVNWSNSNYRKRQIKAHTGKVRSIQSRENQSIAQRGTMWINNGLKSRRIKKYEKIPDGWNKGRKLKNDDT